MIALLAWLAFARSPLRPARCSTVSRSGLLSNLSSLLRSYSALDVAGGRFDDGRTASNLAEKKMFARPVTVC